MGQHNKRALVHQLQKTGVASRAALARSLGMSQPTAGKIVDELLAAKILEELEVDPNGHGDLCLGRPGRQLRLNRSQPSFVGIHLGIKETQLAELPIGGVGENFWNYSFRNPTVKSGQDEIWQAGLRSAAKKLRFKKFLGVLVSVPGIVDEKQRKVVFSPNLHWTEQADLLGLINRVWGAPVMVMQEEHVLALGYYLNNPSHEDFLLVDFGDGVGGAVIIGGKPFASPLPINGELGHTPAIGNDRRCGCGAIGCVETLLCTSGLLKSFASAHPKFKHDWATLQQSISENGIEPWLSQSLDAAAVAIAGALNVLGLRRVIITGNLTELPPAVLTHLSRAVQKGTMWARFGKVECSGAARCRADGLVAGGIDRLIVPDF